MVELYRRVEEGEDVDNKVMMKSVFGILLHNASNMQSVEQVKRTVQDNTDRISALEAKVGSSEEVAVPLGLAIQHMPLPTVGTSDLQNVKEMLAEVRAPGVTVDHDVIKVTRKGNKAESRPGAGDSRLGTVLVEIASLDKKASIMKTKKVLQSHENPSYKNLVIRNMETQQEM